MQRAQLAIIGGGLVGASLALALQEGARTKGWKIVLIEAFAPDSEYQPSYDARSTALAYGTQQIYQQLGIWQEVAKRAEAIADIHVSEQGRFAAARLNAHSEGVPALGFVVENAWLGHCLWQALDPEVIEWRCPAQVTKIAAQADGYQLDLDDGASLSCELAILADGGRSALREQLGIAVQNTPYHQTALIANISPDLPHQGQAFERFTEQGPLALLPLVDNRCALVWTQPGAEAERLLALPDAQFLAQLQQVFGYRLGTLQQVGRRYLYPLSLLESQEQVRANLVVLGNAAHSLHPIAGQGYNLSLRDTLCLAQTLLEDTEESLGALSRLQRYVQRQRQDQLLTVGFSDRVTRLFSNRQPLLAASRSLGLLGLELLPAAKHWFAQQAMGLATRGH